MGVGRFSDEGVAWAGERYGARKVAAMLAGDVEGLPEPLTGLSTTGLLRHEPPGTIERWIEAAWAAGLIRVRPKACDWLT